jgi:tripartite-type tricarboxylate transporter receptor subunit TctC
MSITRRHLINATLASCAALASVSMRPALAQSKLLKLVVPLTPGTTPDTIARAIGPIVAARLDMNMVVENRVGASGLIGMSSVAKSNDPATLMVVPATTVTLPLLYKNVDFDVLGGFSPITQATSSSFVLCVHASTNVKTFAEFVSWAKAGPKHMYASPGNGTHHHLMMELLKQMAGFDLEHIPYKGSAPAVNDFVGGQVPAMFLPIQVAVPWAAQGRIRILGGSLKERHPGFPDIPSLHELGVKDYQVDPWFAIWGTPNMPTALVESYRAAINAALNDASVKANFAKQGLLIKTGSPAELLEAARAEQALWTRVVGRLNIKPE